MCSAARKCFVGPELLVYGSFQGLSRYCKTLTMRGKAFHVSASSAIAKFYNMQWPLS